MINERLALLGLHQAELCSDAEFLRRASLDATGTLPAPDEVREFLKDSRPDKRSRKIDELLARPAFAACWANRICDWTGCNPAQQAELGQETAVQWAEWIRRRLERNEPWDKIVRGIVLAKGRRDGQDWLEYAEEVSACFREGGLERFATQTTMPHYWTRRSMQKPDDAAQAFAQNFLGIRLQCAQCHKHPFAPWTQQDFREFSRFFESIKFGVPPEAQMAYKELAGKTGLQIREPSAGAAVTPDLLRQAQQGRTIPGANSTFKEESPALAGAPSQRLCATRPRPGPTRTAHGLDQSPQQPMVRQSTRQSCLGRLLSSRPDRTTGRSQPRKSPVTPQTPAVA
ncbi:MAG UNVERIFIED_CONTAM: DUF1549 domain-containing protein [Planctomycetaceae bacterium]|jgi:hypothetical protein